MKNVSAIIVADMHLRESQPECRTDNFMQAQARKLEWLSELQERYDVPVLIAGDVFTYWKPSPYLLAWAFRHLPNNIIAIPGEHDLPAHNLENIGRSGIQVLADAGKIKLLTGPNDSASIGKTMLFGYPWGVEWTTENWFAGNKIAMIHYGVYEDKPHYPGAENHGGTAKSVIKKLSGFNLIVSGDNHLTFDCTVGKQTLVNAGSFMRTSAAQINHKPCVYLWDEKTNDIEKVFIPIEKDVISREHIEKVTERDERIEAFISKLNHNIEISISYKNNMRNYLAQNNISKNITDMIWGSME